MNDKNSKTIVNETNTIPSSGTIRSRRRMAQNFLLVWIDADIDQSKEDYQNAIEKFKKIINDVNIFTESEQFIEFLNTIDNEKAFMIISKSLSPYLVPKIHDMTQLDAIYILSDNEIRNEEWMKIWSKIKGIYTSIESICEALKLAAKQCNQDSIAVSFLTVNEENSKKNLNQLDSTFMYTQIFKEILLELDHNEQSIKDLSVYCRKLYKDNTDEIKVINEFEHAYQPASSIWWYTRECFIYHMLNRSLRTLEADNIVNMGFFIRDLHRQIEQLYKKQIEQYHGETFLLYRGQGLSTTDFEKLQKSKDGLISFNNFLSTSKNPKISLNFAKGALAKTDTVGIFFEMSIDPNVASTPFASITNVSYFQDEEEILFSMHTVFRIGDIIKIDNNESLYHVELRLTTDDDEQLRILTRRIQEDTVGSTGWERLGNLLVKIGQTSKAEELYEVLLSQTSNHIEKALYYNGLGFIKSDQGDYEKAIWYYKNALEIREKSLPANHPSLATLYNNIAEVYYKVADFSKALSFFEKALNIRREILPENHPDLSTSYNNVASVLSSRGDYSNALSFYEKAVEIRQKILPANHPDLATTYNNIASVYMNMKQNAKALLYFEKAFNIRQKTLPPNHPSLATSYNNIAGIFDKMEEYSKALSFYEKARTIFEKVLPENHPNLATLYNNIGFIHENMGNYPNALTFHEKAFAIRQKTLIENHPDLATSYNNIASVYHSMGEYKKALSFAEHALIIWQRSLQPDHPNLQSVRKNIETIQQKMKK